MRSRQLPRVIVLALTLAIIVAIGGCSGADSDSAEPVDARCSAPEQKDLDKITSTFVAPVDVIAAYEVASEEVDGLSFVTVATDGFPEGVTHKAEETPAPSYAYYKGKLYTASGQAIRYYGESIPNVTDKAELSSSAYDEANNLSFECAKTAL